jgi:hypothetical protein
LKTIVILAQCLEKNFDRYFAILEGNYYIQDKFPVCSIYNKRTTKVKQKVNVKAKDDVQEKERFLSFYSKAPSADI